MNLETGRTFWRKTQYQYLGESDQSQGVPNPRLEEPWDLSKPTIALPKPNELDISGIDLKSAIESRRSIRSYSSESLTLEELSWLLWATQGVKEVVNDYVTLRNVPSAGARHAFETYLLINRVEGLEKGLYRFLALDHELGLINSDPGIAESIEEAALSQTMITKSCVTFIWTAVVYRMVWRYQERGFRYLFIDAGHVCQNLYLASLNCGCGCCAIAAFNDEKINKILNLDERKQFTVYLAPVGKIKKKKEIDVHD